ncbi:MAG: hypothetical protein KAJ12_10085, partial [Bacteroidetes bacterium]|nr:hypothetical protein [Bacteroidota bacterium]
MSHTLLLLLFFATVTSLSGLMQWRLYRLYRRWIHSSFDTRQQARWLRAARLTLLAANTLI